MGNGYKTINMLLSEGALEIMDCIDALGIARFTNFKKLKNSRTGSVFSANTLSTRLKELISCGAIENTVIKSEAERRVVGYKLTAAGRKALAISKEYENKLENVLKSTER